MRSSEFNNENNEGLPILTQEVFEQLKDRRFSVVEATALLAQSDPLLYEKVNKFIDATTFHTGEKIAAYISASYLYLLLCEAQKAESKS